ncbi:MAG: YggT family protein [Nitrospirota bacterium]
MKIFIYQFINYTLSFLMWMILGKGILTLMVGRRQNMLFAMFDKVTEPIYKVTRKLVPFAKDRWIPALSIVLIIIIRLALAIAFKPAAQL